MAVDLTQSWWGRNFEKIILLAAMAIFVAVLVRFVAVRQSKESVLLECRTLIQNIKEDVDKADLPLTPQEKTDLGLDEEPYGVSAFQAALAALPAAWDAGPRYVSGHEVVVIEVAPTVKPKPPARVLPVEDLRLAVGRGVTNEAVPQAVAKLTGRNLADILWVSLVGRFDLTEQFRLNREGHTDQKVILISAVDLQRRVQMPGGKWSEWQDIPGAMPAAAKAQIPALPADGRDRKAVFEWWRGLSGAQEQVRRAPFFELLAADGQTVYDVAGAVAGVVEQPRIPVERPAAPAPAAELPVALAPPPPRPAAPGEWRPYGLDTAPAPTPLGPEGVAGPEKVYATVWAHDLGLEPGKTYQYRMRVHIFNPIYAQPHVEDEKARWVLALPGAWSEPGSPVTIAPLVQFYFVGLFGDKANLSLHRWICGQWVIAPSVPGDVGAPVVYRKARTRLRVPGTNEEIDETVDLSPGVLLVDLVRNFRYQPEGAARTVPTNLLIYADEQGNLGQRVEWEDKEDEAADRVERASVVPTAPKRPVPVVRPPRVPSRVGPETGPERPTEYGPPPVEDGL